ncbi:MAG: HD domain-containing protein [Patescibacteria group bacterium]
MNLSPLVWRALNFAAKKHEGQKRKADGLPFLVHPVAVAWILSEYTDDEKIIAAGLLHDILEDVEGDNYEEIIREFGPEIAEFVKDVSEDKDPNEPIENELPWMERKQSYLDHLKKTGRAARLISTADKIHNLQSMMDAYDKLGENIWTKFNSPPGKKIWFYEEVYKIVADTIPETLKIRYGRLLEEAKQKFKLP